ncbi:MAG: prolipoprotein diacylglyceryl transferase [Anaerolineaceae bacterium]|jgi:phosphatidylglycerol:prolipoprotein diacylglycerol transferase|nr:prolipoprotein diacylglyceryl transferase [Anaerolineaceae bacterium]
MPTGFQIGPLFVHYYGLIIMIGALAGAWLADRLASKRGLEDELIWDALPWLLIAGIIGARIWHILTPSASNVAMGLTTKYYLSHPLDMLSIWNGGLGIPGGVMGGVLALYLFVRKRKVSFPVVLDVLAPGLILAQAIGRWGNFVNQELYGAPSDLPWAIAIDPVHRLPGFEQFTHFHPLFLYESLLNVAIAGILLYVGSRFKNVLKDGDVFLMYMVAYPMVRFSLEYLRLDVSNVGGINANQTLMAVIALVSIGGLIWRHRPGAVVETGEPKAAAEKQETVE